MQNSTLLIYTSGSQPIFLDVLQNPHQMNSSTLSLTLLFISNIICVCNFYFIRLVELIANPWQLHKYPLGNKYHWLEITDRRWSWLDTENRGAEVRVNARGGHTHLWKKNHAQAKMLKGEATVFYSVNGLWSCGERAC